MARRVNMNIVKIYLLFLFMTATTNTVFAGQGDNKEQAEPECDYITGVNIL